MCRITYCNSPLDKTLISDKYKIALLKDIKNYINSNFTDLNFDNSVLELKIPKESSYFLFFGPLRLANGLRSGWKFEFFVSLRDEPTDSSFSDMFKNYPHPKNICQSSKLLIATNGIKNGNNIVFFPENVKSTHIFNNQKCAVFFFDKFYKIYNSITLPLINQIGLAELPRFSYDLDQETNYKARCVWGYLHDYFHHQGPLPFDENIKLKTNWYIGVIEEIKVDMQSLITLYKDATLPYRDIVFEYIICDRLFRYTQEFNCFKNFDSATSYFLIQYLFNKDVLVVTNNLLSINLKLLIPALQELVNKILYIENMHKDNPVTFKTECTKLFFSILKEPNNDTEYYSISKTLQETLKRVHLLS